MVKDYKYEQMKKERIKKEKEIQDKIEEENKKKLKRL